MSEKVLILFLIFSISLFTSCSSEDNRGELHGESKEKQELSSIDQILGFIENEDSEGLKSMFSQTVLEEDENLDKEIKYLFELFQGEVVSCKDSGVGESETNEYGIKTKKVRSFYKIDTDIESYVVFLFEYTEDTNNQDRESQFTSWQDMVIPGVYMPQE